MRFVLDWRLQGKPRFQSGGVSELGYGDDVLIEESKMDNIGLRF